MPFLVSFPWSMVLQPQYPFCEEWTVDVLNWNVEKVVKETQWQHPYPGTGPRGRLFVRDPVLSQVLQWGHFCQFACFPGTDRAISLLRFYWWPTLDRDTWEFMAACEICA